MRIRKLLEYGLVWLVFPGVVFGLIFVINPWILLHCTLGNPFFEMMVDTFQVVLGSDAVSRFIFFILFLYVHMLLPTSLWYYKKNKKVFKVTILIWVIVAGATLLNVFMVYFFNVKLGKS